MKQRTPDRFSTSLGNRLRFQMKEAGLKTDDVARALGITRFSVLRQMRGEAVPSVEQLLHYAHLFGVSLDELTPPTQAWAPWDSNPQPTGDRFVEAEFEAVAS